jgi:DNA uptake protein ComE-like DNA-binding protein
MPFNPDPLKQWLGHDRKERRAATVLLIIIAVILAVRNFYPEKNIDIEDITEEMSLLSEEHPGYSTAISPGQTASQARYAGTRVNYTKKQAGKSFSKNKIELNTCDSAELVALPGIGPVLSARILKFRNLLGGFASVAQLKEVYGLPPETFEMIKDRVTADTTRILRIKINTAEYRDLSRFPYFEKYEISSILKYRNVEKKIKSLNELVENKLLTADKASRLRPYLRFD